MNSRRKLIIKIAQAVENFFAAAACTDDSGSSQAGVIRRKYSLLFIFRRIFKFLTWAIIQNRYVRSNHNRRWKIRTKPQTVQYRRIRQTGIFIKKKKKTRLDPDQRIYVEQSIASQDTVRKSLPTSLLGIVINFERKLTADRVQKTDHPQKQWGYSKY